MAINRKRLVRPIVYGTLGLIVLAFFAHPYSRQMVFGPRIRGMPFAYWQDRYRSATSLTKNQDSYTFKLLKLVRIEPVRPTCPSGDDMLPVLLRLADDPSDFVRGAVAHDLGGHAESAEACETILRMADDACDYVREGAAQSLGVIAPSFAPALPKLRALMADESPECRLRAARAVYTLERDRTAIALVLGLMENRDTEQRALQHLAGLAAKCPELVDEMHKICRKGGRPAEWCLIFLRRHDPGRAVPILTEALTYSDPDLRMAATQGLGEFGPAAKASIPDLVMLLADPNPFVRRSAAEALSRIDPERYPQKK
jgi:hypothetical protein